MQVTIDTTKALQQAEQFTKDIVIPEIKTQEDLAIASNSRKMAKKGLAAIDLLEKSITRPINEAKSNAIKLFKPFKDKLNLDLNHLDPRIKRYNDEQDKIIQAEEDRLQKEKDKEVERLRKRADNAKKPKTVERLQEQAEQIEAIPAIVLPPKKTEGLHFMEIWKFKIEDESKIPDDYKMIDEVKIGKVVKATKGQMNIPGVKIYPDKVPVSK